MSDVINFIHMDRYLLHYPDPVHQEDVVPLEQALKLLKVHIPVQVRVDEADERLLLGCWDVE